MPSYELPPLKSGLFGRGGRPKKAPGEPPAPKGPSGFRLEHRIGVRAPPEVIWGMIGDLERWGEWNPLYPRAAGQIRIGETLTLTLAVPGQPQQEIRPTVMDWVPNEQLHWRLSLLGGFVKTIRYIEIEKLADEGCIVSNGEIFSGLMGPSMAKRLSRPIRRGFREMSEALKERAEAAWRAQKG